jgi:hypothetical protein
MPGSPFMDRNSIARAFKEQFQIDCWRAFYSYFQRWIFMPDTVHFFGIGEEANLSAGSNML